jgi:type I restriction enzyme, S subunit
MSLAWNILRSEGETFPGDWKVRRIGDITRLVNGYPFPSESFGPTGTMPLVRIRDLTGRSPETSISGDIPSDVILQDGDVVVAMDGDFNLVMWDRGEAALNQRLCILRPRPGTDIRFVAYRLPYLLRVINDLTFSTTVKHLSSAQIRNERIALPPLDEQLRISGYLDRESKRIDLVIDLELQRLRRLHERRRAGVTEEVTGSSHPERRATALMWTLSLPAMWPEVRLGLVARMGSGHTPSRSRPEWWINCTIPWITTGEVQQVRDDRREDISETRERISEIGLANSAAELCEPGTVVLCRTASAGYSAVMAKKMATSQDFATWKCGSRLDPYYLLWCLRAMRDDLMGRLAVGSTHKTIYVPDLQTLRIPLPEISEQQAIVSRIRHQNSQIDQTADTIEREIRLLRERREALITAAVTGKFDVSAASGRGVTE